VRNEPGAVYEYNDVRVNALALAALCVWRRPLPQVLREYVMDAIDASPTWRWYGYETSWVELDGEAVQSVSGGGHWGGGMFISAHDMARFGLLTLRRGRWRDKQLLSEEWLRQATTPSPAQPTYGFMNFFLNTGRKYLPSAPASAFAHVGNGTNIVYVDPENDLVVVSRWIENGAVDGFISRVLASINAPAAEVKGRATPLGTLTFPSRMTAPDESCSSSYSEPARRLLRSLIYSHPSCPPGRERLSRDNTGAERVSTLRPVGKRRASE